MATNIKIATKKNLQTIKQFSIHKFGRSFLIAKLSPWLSRAASTLCIFWSNLYITNRKENRKKSQNSK